MIQRLIASALLIALGFSAQGLDLPEPPVGMTWEETSAIGGALLVPDTWHFRALQEGDRLAYFITEAPWEPPQTFEVGLTFNVIFDVPSKMKMPPTDFAASFVAAAEATQETVRTWNHEMGPFRGKGIVYRGVAENAGFQFFHLVIANDRTGTAYLVTFEAPEASWDTHWRAIEPTVQKLLIDDEY